jgi:leader peptidase (prepilin peptidase)/N-methyltransferase
MEVTMTILVFVLGLCLGSFLNVVIYRLPREETDISHPRRSVCPRCDHSIAWYDNLPLVSYIMLRGRCRHCGERISPRYPLVELIAGILTVAVFFKSGLTIRAVAELYLVMALTAISFIDLEEMIIPDLITLPGMVIGLAAAVASPQLELTGLWLGTRLFDWGLTNFRLISLIGSVLGLVLGGGIIWLIFEGYYLWRKEEGIGGGDFTLMAMIGAFLGWRSIFLTIFFGSVLAMLAAVGMSIRKGEFLSPRMKLPFGPFLSLAALIYLFFGPRILAWYLG